MNAREREAQQQRRQSAADWAEESGGYVPTAFKNPKNVKSYKLEDGIHDFDVIPFLAKYACLKSPKVDPGMEIWHRSYGRHKIPGPQGSDVHYLCLYETFGVACPICKKQTDRNTPKEIADAIRSQRRLVMLVNDKPGDQTNPLKILNAVYYNRGVGFGEQLRNSIKMNTPDGNYFYDWDQKDGRTLRIMVADEKWAKIGGINMVRRNYAYPYALIEQAPSLDECFLVPRPKELEDVPYDQFSDTDWKKVYEELSAIINGEVISPAVSIPAPRQEPQQELPAVSAKPIPPISSSPNPPINPPERIRQPEPAPASTTLAKPGCPYKIGDQVLHHGQVCEVKAIEGGRLLTLLDPDDDLLEDVPFAAVKPLEKGAKSTSSNGNGSPDKHAKATATARKGLADDDDLDDIDEDEND